MARYEVIESMVWKRDDGKTASIYGAVPWTSPAEEKRWAVVSRGWTILDKHQNTIGLGRVPFMTHEEARAHADKINQKYDINAGVRKLD